MNPQFPLYIPSKGRAYNDNRLTYKHLELMGVPYYIIVEEDQYCNYKKVVKHGNILILDKKYQEEYNTCDDLGDTRSKGPGAARNFAWDHSIQSGFDWHWVMDDNINGFYRFHNNLKTPVGDGTIFRCMEDFCLRYENIAMAGPNYFMFITRKATLPPFIINTRIYSCNLIRNNIERRWRGRYNEDTILSLDILKDGLCTVQFNAFLQYKMPTQSIKGGNTKEFYHAEGKLTKGERYAIDGTLAKSQMQVDMHPDVSRLVWKFGRWHHHVNYSVFKRNKLKFKPGIEIKKGIDNYGMELLEFDTADEARAWEIERAKIRQGESG